MRARANLQFGMRSFLELRNSPKDADAEGKEAKAWSQVLHSGLALGCLQRPRADI